MVFDEIVEYFDYIIIKKWVKSLYYNKYVKISWKKNKTCSSQLTYLTLQPLTN